GLIFFVFLLIICKTFHQNSDFSCNESLGISSKSLSLKQVSSFSSKLISLVCSSVFSSLSSLLFISSSYCLISSLIWFSPSLKTFNYFAYVLSFFVIFFKKFS